MVAIRFPSGRPHGTPAPASERRRARNGDKYFGDAANCGDLWE